MNISRSTSGNGSMDSTLVDAVLKIKEKKKNNAQISVPMPTSSEFKGNTKTEPEMTEDEYIKAITVQAQAQADGTGNQADFMRLKNSYCSVSSPDRKKIISDTIRSISQGSNGNKSVSSLEIKDKEGNKMATYDRASGWHMIATPAEIVRESQFNRIFNTAFNLALSSQNKLNRSV